MRRFIFGSAAVAMLFFSANADAKVRYPGGGASGTTGRTQPKLVLAHKNPFENRTIYKANDVPELELAPMRTPPAPSIKPDAKSKILFDTRTVNKADLTATQTLQCPAIQGPPPPPHNRLILQNKLAGRTITKAGTTATPMQTTPASSLPAGRRADMRLPDSRLKGDAEAMAKDQPAEPLSK